MSINKDFNFSYWETKQYFIDYDLVVIGAGIVGLSTAISYKLKHKKARVLVLERGILPSGASTKNAGFACFGSATELLDDLANMEEDRVWSTVQMRWEGLLMLRKRLGDKKIGFQQFGGYELFLSDTEYDETLDQLEMLNKAVKNCIGLKDCYQASEKFGQDLNKINGLICNQFEGQLDTAMMMQELVDLARKKEISILNTITVESLEDLGEKVMVHTGFGAFSTKQCVVATNGFAKQLLDLEDVEPARAQVLITEPIPKLKLKGTFHFDKGYYYFRNIDNRILFGGGRNKDFDTEKTAEFGLNHLIQSQLDEYLKGIILPGKTVKVEQRWSGIMGVGSEKMPIIRNTSTNVLALVRMGGMGIAIGTKVGELAVEKLH